MLTETKPTSAHRRRGLARSLAAGLTVAVCAGSVLVGSSTAFAAAGDPLVIETGTIVTVPGGLPLDFTPGGNVPLDPASFKLDSYTGDPANVTVVTLNGQKAIHFVPPSAAPYPGVEERIVFHASELGNLGNTASGVINVFIDDPSLNPSLSAFAANPTVTLAAGAQATVTLASLTGAGSDPIDPASVTIIKAPAKGVASAPTPDGSFTYKRNANYYGSDSISFSILPLGAPLRNAVMGTVTIAATAAPTPTPSPTTPPKPAGVSRLGGPDRFATSAKISAANYAPGVPVAYVTSGHDFPDALSAAPVAGTTDGPVLIVHPNEIPAVMQTELARLKPARIVILGGNASVSTAVARTLKGYTTGAVTRWGGVDRFETAAIISAASYKPGVPVAYVTSGHNFPDALSAAAAAGKNGGPVLITRNGELPPVIKTELARLEPGRIVVLGGTASVTADVAAQLKSYTTGSVTRLGGADRYDTSALISQANFGTGVPVAYVTSGQNFPDALSGAPVAADAGGPVLLVQPGVIPSAIKAELARLRPARIVILGGTASVSADVAAQLKSLVSAN